MLSPFFVFPKIGYINSQFQFVANQANLEVEVFQEDKLVYQVRLDLDSSVIFHKLDIPGKYCAKCLLNGVEYTQEFEVQNAWMLGTSTISYVKVFDYIPYTFVVMKDRLLIYDELKDIVYKEYLVSPSAILKLDNNNLLFKKVFRYGKDEILNLSIFCLSSLSMIAELSGGYKSIFFKPNQNLLWLQDIQKNSILCFNIFDDQHKPFIEKVKYTKFINHHVCKNEIILLEYPNEISIVDAVNIQEYKILKNDNVYVDLYGNSYSIINDKIKVFSFKTKRTTIIDRLPDLRCSKENGFFIGSSFNKDLEAPNISSFVEANLKEISNSEKKDSSELKFKFNYEVVNKQFQNHKFYPTLEGVFCVFEELTYKLCYINYKREGEKWTYDPCFTNEKTYIISIFNSDGEKILFNSKKDILFPNYKYPFLEFYNEGKHIIVPNGLLIDGCLVYFYESNNLKLIVVEKDKKHSIYKYDTTLKNILVDITILNIDYITSNNVIWYEKRDDEGKMNGVYGLNYVDFSTYKFTKESYLKFNSHFILDSNKIIDAKNGKLLFNYLGTWLAYSYGKRKYVCERDGVLLLNILNDNSKYEIKEINLNYEIYKEAYLSPNGAFLVLKKNENKYMYYDIKSDKVITFLSGDFIKFNYKGEFIIQDQRRNIKLIDPVTFQEITPKNYKYYQFSSPDGELFAGSSLRKRFYDILSGSEISNFDKEQLRLKFDFPTAPYLPNSNQKLDFKNKIQEIKNNRQEYFELNKDKLVKYEIKKAEDIISSKLFFTKQFLSVGVCKTDERVEVELPIDLQYFNFAAFSYDNKYLGLVGKPTFDGYIKIVKLNYDKETNSLEIEDGSVFESRRPSMATWVCAFSKTGYFATYDSSPTTYLIKLEDEVFYNISLNDQNKLIYNPQKYENDKYWKHIPGNSFLCFSSSGRFIALSDQGYSAMSLGGIGHWPSKVVELAAISNDNVYLVKRYTGFGGSVQDNSRKKIAFSAFSEDETKLMVLTNDGVVTVRDIKEDLHNAGYEIL